MKLMAMFSCCYQLCREIGIHHFILCKDYYALDMIVRVSLRNKRVAKVNPTTIIEQD